MICEPKELGASQRFCTTERTSNMSRPGKGNLKLEKVNITIEFYIFELVKELL